MKFDTRMSIQESDHAPNHGVKRARKSPNQHYAKIEKELGSLSDSEEEQPAKKRMVLDSDPQRSFEVPRTNGS
ncbi:hypothetical protein LTR16_001880 [Cryomyces antarcticus]|uniref:Uncharacterized protein n=1 Tax=Cryomyces antarcticus TaxID=329879 RepID=A0ABR0LQ15_9PEZI|nr:hypothetical protein LTR16_001880 [Cryomyces antarcticus]